MDVTGIANLATALATQKNSDAVNIAVLKKALDSQANAAVGLIQALPPVPSNPNVGRNVNTTA
ncbi:YjfB family protein [Herbaspirillum autotrophicum]|uniref:YjfB family protein n=1 Tax=Herbaspirillum autotrophicum TaxID=180195 RepID=UPI00067B4266|nr:YjfB family protein [Herbaspirillum autotrophicum]